ncbi:MAG: 50S ribosomal protein L18 [Planctomycetes bacterium]|nr:50S ribosomal protein L18 [Planctomycetota bacterium]
MNRQKSKLVRRKRRSMHVRKRIVGTAQKPRLTVFRSLRHISTQLIDDLNSHTLCSISTLSPEVKKNLKKKSGNNIESAKLVGKKLAELAVKKGIKEAVFDRGPFPYHGRLKALAEAVRAGGLKL